ncbi:hypothetical protein ABLE68_13650 [Nocardioides sp. CN2-186]|uniref:hypothetical protein n=1 Tax=Nocardioides tweenelious TaxID=3156607 RepID=UPI0032B61E0F
MPLTQQAELRQMILETLAGLPGGAGRRRDVLVAMNHRFQQHWTVQDLQPPSQRPHEANWMNRASYERMDMVREGLLRPDSSPGIWALSAAGWEVAGGSTPSPTTVSWDLGPGDDLNRADRAELYGGAERGGIQPSSTSPNVFLYSDPAAGEIYGYTYDGWDRDADVFLYTGEGRSGDQRIRVGNRAIVDHVVDGRALRLFVADGFESTSSAKRQVYLGEFQIDSLLPFVRAEAPDTEGVLRSVVVFRLRPVGAFLRRPQDVSAIGDVADRNEAMSEAVEPTQLREAATSVEDDSTEVELEADGAATFLVSPVAQAEGVRREALLTRRFRVFMSSQGRTLRRYRVRPAGAIAPLYTDVYDIDGRVLYEAKAASTRENVRMAIGQLLDYRRLVPSDSRLAILVPTPPADDLIALLEQLGIGLVVQATESRFEWHLGEM